MARIAIDATPLSIHGKGLSRFIGSLIHALSLYADHHTFTLFIDDRLAPSNLPSSPRFTYIRITFSSSLKWDIVQLSVLLRRYPVDLLFSCSDRLPIFYNGSMQLYLFELPHVRHQLHLSQPNTRPSTYARISMKITEVIFPWSIRRARHIFASSIATKHALLDTYALSLDKIDVIYPGLDDVFSPLENSVRKQEMRVHFGAPKGYILHFSSQSDPRDNTEVALRAFHVSQQLHAHDIKLVIAGKTNPDKQKLSPVVEELGLFDQVIWAGFIPEKDLVDVYRSAELYFDPSLYEGFGYQVLEAMACGTPVVCSNVTSLPEIVGTAALISPPMDIYSFAEHIAHVITSAEVATKMRADGIALAQRFSWHKTVTQLMEAYDRALASRDSH